MRWYLNLWRESFTGGGLLRMTYARLTILGLHALVCFMLIGLYLVAVWLP